MTGYIEGWDRRQRLLLPDCVDDYVGDDSPVRVVDAFIDELDLQALGFADNAATGRPGYHPATLLKLYLYGYLNQVQSSGKLEREAGRNVEVMWLTGKLAPDFKTIADFRRDNGAAIRVACRQFVEMCRHLGLVASGTVAVDGSRFKAVNTRDKNFTPGAIRRRMEQVDAGIERYLDQLEAADRHEDGAAEPRATRLTERIDALRRRMRQLQAMARRVEAAPDRQVSLTDPDARAMATHGKGTGLVGYNVQAAVDTDSHIVVAHEVTNIGHDRTAARQHGPAGEGGGRCRGADGARRPGLLLWPRGPGLRGVGHHADLPEAADLRRAGRGPLWQARLRLPDRQRHVPMPSRRNASKAIDQH